jgi:hypothetical protein
VEDAPKGNSAVEALDPSEFTLKSDASEIVPPVLDTDPPLTKADTVGDRSLVASEPDAANAVPNALPLVNDRPRAFASAVIATDPVAETTESLTDPSTVGRMSVDAVEPAAANPRTPAATEVVLTSACPTETSCAPTTNPPPRVTLLSSTNAFVVVVLVTVAFAPPPLIAGPVDTDTEAACAVAVAPTDSIARIDNVPFPVVTEDPSM